MSTSCLVLLALSGQLIETERQPTEWERTAIDSRKAIMSSHVVYTVNTTSNGEPRRDHVEAWCDGVQMRADHSYDNVLVFGVESPTEPRKIGNPMRIFCSESQYAVFHPDDLDVLVRVGRADEIPEPHVMHLVDPRYFGLSAFRPLIADEYQKYVNRPIGETIEETTEMLDDVLHHRIQVRVRYEPEVTYTMWLCPERDSLPTQIVQRGTYEDRLEVVWKEWDGVWFPERLERMRLNSAREEESRMVVSFESAEFNIDIDSQVFTLAGLEMPIGHPIDDWMERPPRYRQWDGERVVDHP